MAWTATDEVLSFRDSARANNYPLVDRATWVSDTGLTFPKSLILDVNLVAMSTKAIVGLSSISVTGQEITVTFADRSKTFKASAKQIVPLSVTGGEYELPVYDSILRNVGTVILDAASASEIIKKTQQVHSFDTTIHAIVPTRVAYMGPNYECVIKVGDDTFYGMVPIISEGAAWIGNGEVIMVGNGFVNMTDKKWQARRRSLRTLNNIDGVDAQGVILQNLPGSEDSLRVSVRDGAIHFSLAGLSQ